MIAREVIQLTEDGASLISISSCMRIVDALRTPDKNPIAFTENAKVPLFAKGAQRE